LDLDIVVFGATGFTGRKAVRYLSTNAPPGLRWGIAARDPQRLRDVEAGDVPRFVVDVHDPAAVRDVVAHTRVALSFVGPYALHGDVLVDACAEHGTDYVDITGETTWVRRVIDRLHGQATERGTRIVPFCGFDSVPSDLGTWMMVDHVRRTWNVGTREVFAAFRARGGVSGGTIASGLEMMASGRGNDPRLLDPDELRTAERRAQATDFRHVTWSAELGRWLTPFVMGPYNTRVVRRSAALAELAGAAYGHPFRYQEAMETRSRVRATGMAAGSWAADRLLRSATVRSLAKRLLRRPGEGPSDEAIGRGFYHVRLRAIAEDGREMWGHFGHRSDPGYGSTITMACEAALTLVLVERAALPGGASRGGVLTPAFALGGPYLRRLRAAGIEARAGVTPPFPPGSDRS
jgi:short subunit dehydrogenase-like uncharacterized protein